MFETKSWHVELRISEQGDLTRADAVLETGDTSSMRGVGHARRNPVDSQVPEIGDELAAARALSDLAHRLLDAAADDIEGITHEKAYVRL